MPKIKDTNKNKVPDVIEDSKIVTEFKGKNRTTQVVILVALALAIGLLVVRCT